MDDVTQTNPSQANDPGDGTGEKQALPRWVYPAAAFGVLLSFLMMNLRVSSRTDHSDGMLGLWAWIPLLVLATIAMLRAGSPTSMVHFFKGIRQHGVQISFGLFLFLPIWIWLTFDEVETSAAFPYWLAATAILGAGALMYIRSHRLIRQILALLASMSLAFAVSIAGRVDYWQERGGTVHPEKMVIGALIVTCVVLTPVALTLGYDWAKRASRR